MKDNSKIWKAKEKAPQGFLEEFSDYPEVITQLLFNRGIKNKEEASQFFEPNYENDLKDPFLALGMKHAVERLKKAIKEKEKIVIFHDYDADGVCSAVVVASTLKEFGVDFTTYTPDRQKEGYGLNKDAIEKIVKDKPDLLITVDCGITNVAEVDLLNKHGVDVIIVDHHLPAETLPEAYAIVNPKQEKCGYKFKDMCAAGVAFRLCDALIKSDLGKELDIKEGFEKWLLDVVAVATIADMMPLLGENRTLVKYGLLVASKTQRLGLRRLLDSGFTKRGIDSKSIAFGVAPKINATSRMTHASVSYELLMAEKEDEVERLMALVEKANNDRRSFVEKATKEAIFWIEKDVEEGKKFDVIVLGSDDWTPGIVGLIAGKLSEKYNVPSFVYGRVGNVFKGSARGREGFNVVEAMAECAKQNDKIFKAFGGHKAAGGFSIHEGMMPDFKKEMQKVAAEKLSESSKEIVLNTEAELSHGELNQEVLNWLLKFEPFGQGNEAPVFSSKGFEVAEARLVGNGEKHLKLKLKTVSKDGRMTFLDSIGFGLGEFYRILSKGDKIDAVFSMEENEWQGRKSLQLKLIDLKKQN